MAMHKRILSAALALVLLLSCVPMTALATETEEPAIVTEEPAEALTEGTAQEPAEPTEEPTEASTEESAEAPAKDTAPTETVTEPDETTEPVVVPVESVTITQEDNLTEVLVGETLTLTAVVLPENATNKAVTWTSSDESIATVDENGIVTGVAEGEVTISVENGDIQDNYVVFSNAETQKTFDQGDSSVVVQESSTVSETAYASFTPGVSTTSEVVSLLNQLSEIQNNKYWNKGCTADQLKQQTLAGDFSSCCTDSPCVSHNDKCTSNTFDGRTQCNGFANYIAYVISGDIRSTSSNWKNIKLWDNTTLETIELSELQPGDVIYYRNRSNLDHWVVVWYTDLAHNKLYVAEANNGKHCEINYGVAGDDLSIILNKVRLVSRCKNIANTTGSQVELNANITVEDYLKYYAQKVTTINRTATVNGTSSETWKLPWTNGSDSSLKLGTVSGKITLIREIVNHVGNTWYEYSTGTGTRGFIYSGNITLNPYYDSISSGTPTTNNTILKTTLHNPSKLKLIQGGFKLGTSASNLSIVKTDNISTSYQTATTIPCSYDLKNEYSITLKPGTRYYYQFFVIEEGKASSPYVSEVLYFDTASVPVTSISLSPTSKSLNIGATVQLTATVSPSNATNKSLTWKSSNTSVATVSSSGLVTAKGVGTATITATAADGSKKTATATITVKPTLVSSISLSPTSKSLNIGATVQLTAAVSPSNATNKSLTWKSSNTSVATVSSSGLVTAKGVGTATITATAADGSGKSASAAITVNTTLTVSKIINVATGVQVQWAAASGFSKYGVWRSDSANGTYTLVAAVASTLYTDTNVTAGKTYYYRISAVDANGTHTNKSAAVSITFVTAPKVVAATSGAYAYWEAIPGATKYGVWCSKNGANGNFELLGTTTATNYTNRNVPSGSTYYYAISIVNADGTHSARSKAVNHTFLSTPTSSVSNVATGVKVSWNRITGALGYAVYRKTYTSSVWTRVYTVKDGDTLSWTDESVRAKNGQGYHYTVRALAGSKLTIQSAQRINGTPIVRLTSQTLKSAVKVSATAIKCTWSTSTVVAGYEVRLMTGGTVYKTYKVPGKTTASKALTGLPRGKTYTVQIRTYATLGTGTYYSAWSNAKSVTLP